MKKKLMVVLLGFVIFLYWHNYTISGEKLFGKLQLEGIASSILLEKEVDITEGSSDCHGYELTREEIQQFYELFRGSEFKDIGRASIPLNSSVEFHVSIMDMNGDQCIPIVKMYFKGDEVLIVDRYWGDKPGDYDRYAIVSTQLEKFFEEVLVDMVFE